MNPGGSKAAKLAMLLGHGASANVLHIGSLPMGWDADFRSHFHNLVGVNSFRELESVLQAGTSYDLILWALPGTPLPVSDSLKRLRRALSPTGSFFALVDNRFAVRKLYRDLARLFNRRIATIPGFRRALRHAGFERVMEFLPLPNVPNVEEFVSSDAGPFALPSYSSAIEVFLNRTGLLPIGHDGGAYLAFGENAGPSSFLREIGERLAASRDGFEQLSIERFDLRDRGALIVLLRTSTSGTKLVCRLTTDAVTDRIVRRNAEWSDRLCGMATLSQRVRGVVPRSVAVFSLRGGNAYVEAHIPGTVAWKLAGSSHLEQTLYAEHCAFIAAFNQDTAKLQRIDNTLSDQLLDPFIPFDVTGSFAEPYEAFRARLRVRILDRERLIVWAHGDFGYGNTIVDSRTALLNGVIDWDQAREDVAGVDLVHFLVQRERGRRACSLVSALQAVGDRFLREGVPSFDGRVDYEKQLALAPDLRLDILGFVALRFAQRDMIYSSLFGTAPEDTRAILEWGLKILE